MRMQPLSIIQAVLAISVVTRAVPLTQQPSVEARDASLPRSDDELAARRFNWGGLLKTGEDIGENIVGDAGQAATGSSGGQPDCLPGVLAILNPACQTPESSNVPVQVRDGIGAITLDSIKEGAHGMTGEQILDMWGINPEDTPFAPYLAGHESNAAWNSWHPQATATA